MSNKNAIETTKNFFAAWENNTPPQIVVPRYKLYYDADGHPLLYTMEEIEGNYIDIDRETYVLASNRVRVVDGRLRFLKSKTTVKKLVPNQPNGTACDPRDVCMIVDQTPNVKWKIKIDEYD